MFYGLPLVDCRKLPYETAVINKINIPEKWHKEKMAGETWMRKFRYRHPQLSLRTAEGCSLARATSFNRHNVDIFFNNLQEAITRSSDFSDGTRIYNLDETATTTVHKPQRVLAEKGAKQISKVNSGERGTLVTTCCIVSAAGQSIPPAIIFPRVHFKQHMLNGAPPGSLGLANTTGWMNSLLFLEVM